MGDAVISALKAEGLPSSVCCMQGLMQDYDYSEGFGGASASNVMESKRLMETLIESRIGSDIKVIQEENSAILIRTLSVCIPRDISWRMNRSYLMSESVEVLSDANPTDGTCSISVTGYLRGAPLYLHSLMHIVGVGACRLASVSSELSPFERAKKHARSSEEPIETVYSDISK